MSARRHAALALLAERGVGPQCPVGVPSSPPICFDYLPFIEQAGGGPSQTGSSEFYGAPREYGVRVSPQF